MRFELEVKAQDEAVAQLYAEEQERQREAFMMHTQRQMTDPEYFRWFQVKLFLSLSNIFLFVLFESLKTEQEHY